MSEVDYETPMEWLRDQLDKLEAENMALREQVARLEADVFRLQGLSDIAPETR